MRDYKYIEQLLERYWECQTTLEEETILRTFFAQDDIPVHLLQYRPLFIAEKEERESVSLGKDFEQRLLETIEADEPVKARVIPFTQRLRPFFRAAAIVAVLITLGTAMEKALEPSDAPYPSDVAFEKVKREGPSVAVNDSVKKDSAAISKQEAMPVIIK